MAGDIHFTFKVTNNQKPQFCKRVREFNSYMSTAHQRYLDNRYRRFYKTLASIFVYILNTGFHELFLCIRGFIQTTSINADIDLTQSKQLKLLTVASSTKYNCAKTVVLFKARSIVIIIVKRSFLECFSKISAEYLYRMFHVDGKLSTS